MATCTSKWLKRSLFASVSSVICLATPVIAEENAAQGAALEEIIVTGAKLQNMRAIEAKRETFQVMDAVSADEIGRLPDFNIGESLARVPGISIRTDQGEARFATVRGLNPDYNTTLLDGSAIAVPDRDGRNVFMEVLPASAAKRLEVFKTLTPDMEGHAIGGIINLVTPSAYDFDDLTINVQGELGQYELNDGFEGSGLSGDADLMIADTFGQNDKFGFVLTGNYFKRDSYLPWAQFERYRFYDADGNETAAYADGALPAPGQRRYHWYHNDRTRYGGMGKFEYKPSAELYSYVKLYYNVAKDDEARQTDVFSNGSGNTAVDQTATSGTLVGDNFTTRQYVGLFNFHRSVWGAQLGADYQMSGDTLLKLRANYSSALFKNPEHFMEWRRTSGDYAFSYVQDGDAFNVTLNDPEAAYNLDNMPANNYNFTDRRLEEDIFEVSADVIGDRLFDSDALGFMAGVKFRVLDRTYNEDKFRYLAQDGNTFSLGASGLATIEGGSEMPGILDDQGIISVNTATVLDVVMDHIDGNAAQWLYDEQSSNDVKADYGVNEKVFAAYGALTYEDEVHHLVTGLRLEATEYSTTGNRAIDGAYHAVEGDGNYLNLLPSISYSYKAAEDMIIRAAYSRTIGRPAFTQFAPSSESASTSGTIPTVSRSNPELKPRVSDNIDLSVEKYLDGGTGIVSLGAFYKRIQDEIYTRSSEQMVEVFGELVLAEVSQPENADDITSLYGLELNVVKNLDFLSGALDGFGVSFNATKLWHNFKYLTSDNSYFEPETMPGMANTMANAALFYDKGAFSAKIALNYTDIQMDKLNSNPDNISYVDEDWQVDFKASYRVMENLAITLNLYNILGESEDLVTGRYLEQTGRESNYGSAYFIGLSYQY